MRGMIFAAAVSAAALLTGQAAASTVYSNDFSANTNGFTMSGTAAVYTAPNSESFIGGLTQGAGASLTLDTTGLSSITVNFDLYGILSIDGSNGGTGPDSFRLSVGGGPVLLDETFSNFSFQNQTYGPNALDPGRTGSDTGIYGHLGYEYVGYPGDGLDTTYHLSFTFAPTGNSTVLNFVGLSTQALSDEYFGIDNVVVTTPGGVPEPATWAMMLLGFAGVGAMVRRSRASALAA